MDVSGFPYSLGKFHIWTCPDFHISIENFKSGHVRSSITDKSVFQLRTRPDFNFSIAKFQIRTRPDFNTGHVRISNFQLRNLRSGHVRISIPDFRFSRDRAFIWSIWTSIWKVMLKKNDFVPFLQKGQYFNGLPKERMLSAPK